MADNTILFVAHFRDRIVDIYELDLGKAGRDKGESLAQHSFKWWYGVIRDRNKGCDIEIRRA